MNIFQEKIVQEISLLKTKIIGYFSNINIQVSFIGSILNDNFRIIEQ